MRIVLILVCIAILTSSCAFTDVPDDSRTAPVDENEDQDADGEPSDEDSTDSFDSARDAFRSSSIRALFEVSNEQSTESGSGSGSGSVTSERTLSYSDGVFEIETETPFGTILTYRDTDRFLVCVDEQCQEGGSGADPTFDALVRLSSDEMIDAEPDGTYAHDGSQVPCYSFSMTGSFDLDMDVRYCASDVPVRVETSGTFTSADFPDSVTSFDENATLVSSELIEPSSVSFPE